MPVNVDNFEAYQELVHKLTRRVAASHEPVMARIIERFWKRLADLAFDFSVVDRAGDELGSAMRLQLEVLHFDMSEVFTTLAIRSIQHNAKSWTPDLYRKDEASEARNRMSDLIRAEALDKSRLINNSVKNEARRLIARGIREGKDLETIANELASNRRLISRRGLKRIRRKPIDHARATVKTEVGAARNRALVDIFSASGIAWKSKQWMQLERETKRESHAAVAAAPPIPYNSEFIVNGYRAFAPHDRRLPAAEVISCGCLIAVRD